MNKKESIWSKTEKLLKREPLPGDVSTEAVVIGGGLAGILTAYFLQNVGIETIVIEADRVGSGQTKNSTAKITSQHGLIYHRLIEQFGRKQAAQYAAANEQAIEDYRQIAEKLDIECNLCDAPAFLYSTHDTELLRLEYEAAKSLGIAASLTDETELPFKVLSALKFDKQARFHPLKFLNAVAEKLTVYEHTTAIKVQGGSVTTDRGVITAKHVIFATHYPFINFPGFYFLRMHQERSYVAAFKNAQEMMGMYYGISLDGYSFRPEGDLILLAGGNHRTGENSTGGQYEKLINTAKQYWSDCELVANWSAQDCMTLDGVPYIGKFAPSEPNWYVATGFEKWGITTSMAAARIISDLIVKGKSENAEVFSPRRFTPAASAKAAFEEGIKSAKALSREFIMPGRDVIDALPVGHGGIVTVDGIKVGVYKDEDGGVYIVSTRCPHMGCQLEWNPDERSWDCPCHGSRFDFRGNLVDNPSQENIEARAEG